MRDFHSPRMLGKAILLIFPLLCVAYSDICKPGAPGAFKVRLNIKKALGDNAYTWNADEEFLFKAVMAFVMRTHINNTIQISNILMCNVTQRVSFWFVVTSPSNNSAPIESPDVENAIRLERNRINSAFLLDDKTLEFVAIPPTLVPIVESSRSWLIVFGVVIGILGVASILLVVSGIKNKIKRKTAKEDSDGSEDGLASVETIEENTHAISHRTDGVNNEAFEVTTF